MGISLHHLTPLAYLRSFFSASAFDSVPFVVAWYASHTSQPRNQQPLIAVSQSPTFLGVPEWHPRPCLSVRAMRPVNGPPQGQESFAVQKQFREGLTRVEFLDRKSFDLGALPAGCTTTLPRGTMDSACELHAASDGASGPILYRPSLLRRGATLTRVGRFLEQRSPSRKCRSLWRILSGN